MALVQWDIGLCQLYRAGHDGAFDLCVLESSPAGVKHVGLACVACKQTPILGTRWSCLDCEDHAVNLCTSCYMADEHDIQHVFQRKDSPRVHGDNEFLLEEEARKLKFQARGIYPGAKVTRGPDWEYDNQDGGIGTFGTVKKIMNWKENPASAATASWENGTKGTYRLGYHGKVDLKCVTANSGGYYYKGHLPSLGQKFYFQKVSYPIFCYIDAEFLLEEEARKLKIQARGIYPGAKVTRGPDWEYDNQDGGIGTFGTVKKIMNWKENPASAATASWENGTKGTYRLGYHGKVDLKCVTANSGGYYYKGHLPSLGQKVRNSSQTWITFKTKEDLPSFKCKP
ncbi:E3 ubiquitin-protein ligase MIB1-like [Orbicella faveolata]|uniref:E3 ubiquitin-protein ligase MIB1-like n=1 Tax=Orbicella faveolata TaxID=48498 RepID=UPI0009E512D5|nr:E3 ubiquitin-protein ligase MIB1-like [Orbicella faveolata]